MGPVEGTRGAMAVGVAISMVLMGMVPWGTRAETTSITPTSGVGDLGTSVNAADTVHTITGGTRPGSGSNLFHSFGSFSVGTGDTANFHNETAFATKNIISRVTGGDRSNIHGGITTTNFPGANLYLLNPAGVLFGPQASLDISGSFHSSTADYLRMGSNGIFYADPKSASTLSTASPSAFGFLGDNPAGITVDGAQLTVPDDETFSLVGGDIQIKNGAFIEAKSGQINIASVASPGEVVPSAPGAPPDLKVDSFHRLGKIETTGDSWGYVWGDGGGTVLIRGGELIISDNSGFSGSVTGPTDGSLVEETGAGIDIQVTGKVLVEKEAALTSYVYNGVSHDSGGIRIRADEVELNNARFDTVGFGEYTDDGIYYPPSLGNAGDIRIEANRFTIRDSGYIRNNTVGSGDGGDIVIRAKNLEVLNNGQVYTLTFGGSTGDAGDIDIKADSITLANPDNLGVSLLTSQTFTTSDAGNLTIATNNLQIRDKAFISSSTFGSGKGGKVTIEPRDGALDVTISSAPDYFSGIFSNTLDSNGPGGLVDLTATNIRIMDNGSIQSASFRGSSGPGGTVKLTANTLEFTAGGFLSARTLGSGRAGDIAINAGTVQLADGLLISNASGSGAAGSITIEADKLELREGSRISVSGSLGLGIADAGNIDIDVKQLLLSDSSVLGIVKDGVGGTIRVQAEESAILVDKGTLNNSSTGEGDSGDIQLSAPRVELLGGSQLVSNSFDVGDGGTIVVDADTLSMTGIHPEPVIFRGETTYAPSGLFTQTFDIGGAGGDVLVQAGLLDIRDGARIDSSTAGAGDGGKVDVSADRVLVAGASERIQVLLLGQGYDPVLAELSSRSMISSSSQETTDGVDATGAGGLIRIDARAIELKDRGLIFSGTSATGSGGDIKLVADNIQLSNKGLISAESLPGGGNAGNIEITARNSFRAHDSTVQTGAVSADGGDIQLTVGDLVYLLGSKITTSVESGEGAGGNIFIDPDFVVLNSSQIIANAFGGPGGNIHIVAGQFIASPDSVVKASSAQSIDGTVSIESSRPDIGDKVTPLPESFLNLSALLRAHCSAVRSDTSSLVTVGQGGTPIHPNDYLPSFELSAQGDSVAGGQDRFEKVAGGIWHGALVSCTP